LEAPLREFFRNRAGFDRLAPLVAPTGGRPAEPSRPADLAPGSRLAGYLIEAELGRGGMGIVYRAQQLRPERPVALKVIRMDRLEWLPVEERRQWLGRFQREAQLVAALDQPDRIVTLYEVGECQGQPYFTMRLVTGGTLAGRLKQTDSPDEAAAAERRMRGQRDSARLLAAVARAVHYAHQRGILHRDLKPANILLDENGRPLVSDFGLARRLDQTGSLVASGIEGTASYMPPEQAAAAPGAATTAADVYSLGAILYECLTGRPPFRGKSDVETLLLVLHQEVVPPRRLNSRLDRDLERICLKCLEKEPGRRYASAEALADDLDNWLAGRPLNIRPAGRAEKLWRWCRRNPVPTVAAATVVAVAVVAFVLIADSRNRAVALADENGKLAQAKGALATANGDLALEKEKEAARATKEAARAREEEKNARREAVQLAFQQATALSDHDEVGRAMHLLAHGLALSEQAGETDLERLFRANLAAWRYHLHGLRRVLPHPAGVSALAWSPDGRTLATACWDRTTRLWDVASGKPRGKPVKHDEWITGLTFSPDGKTLLTVGYAKAGAWEVETGRRVAELDHKPSILTSAAFAPDGHTILTGSTDGKARLWDISGQRLGEPLPHPGWIEAVGFAPDGRFFATGGKDGRILVWEATSRRPVASREHPGGLTALTLGADGRLLSGGEDRTARLWDLSGRRAEPLTLAHQALVKAVALSPDGSLALTGSLDGSARVWDAATGKAVGQPLAHPGEVLAVAFSPDARAVATGQGRERGDARVWDLALGNPLGGPLTHQDSILAVAVSPDGKRVATAGRDHAARLGDARTGEPIGDALPHNADVNAVAFSPDSQTLVSGGDDSTALFWQAATGQAVVREEPMFRHKYQLGVGLKGEGMATDVFSDDQPGRVFPGVSFWGPARGKSMGRRGGGAAAVFALAFSPNGKKLVTAGGGGSAVLWDAQRGARVPFMRLEERDKHSIVIGGQRPKPHLYAAAFSPDGRLVALGGEDGAVRLWDAARYDVDAFIAKAKGLKSQELARMWDEAMAPRLAGGPLKHGGAVVALAFSPNGELLLTGCSAGTARLWDVASGKPRLALEHKGAVVAVAFSPDGQTIVTGSWDGTARVWKTATGDPVCPPLPHQGRVLAVAFSPDGRTVLTGSEDWTARLWDAATGQPVGPLHRHQDQVRAVAFRSDGRAVVTAGDDRTGQLWPVPAVAEGSAARIRDWVEALTGMRRSEEGSIHLLEAAEWEATVARLGDWQPVAPEDRLGWNRRQARAAETAGRWQAARWHLDRLIAADPESGPLYLRRGKAALATHDLAAARRDFDKAVALLPAEWGAWFQRGQLAIRERRWQESIDDMDKALQRRTLVDQVPLRGQTAGGTAPIRLGRGYARAGLGHWKEAADDLAVIRSPWENSSPSDWAAYALVLLRQGDARSYGAACSQMLAKFSRPEDEARSTIVTTEYGGREVFNFGRRFDPEGAATMAWVSCLSPNGLTDFALPLRLARRAASLDKNSYPIARAHGAALYRAKDYEAAVKQLEAAGAMRTQAGPSVWLLLAMAQQRCQRKDQAKEWLGKARGWIAKARSGKPRDDGKEEPAWDRLPWTEQLALEFLEGEATKLIEGELPKQ
jgi:WD40 repeat protein/tetratricopeptide (TPR) repeat protein